MSNTEDADESVNQGGRPTQYDPKYAEQAKKICERFGATDYDLAQFFGVHRATIYRWKLEYPEFCDAIKLGKDIPDDRVERALYERAIGYQTDEKEYPPDVTACLAWLNNRRPDRWRQKPEGAPIDADTLGAIIGGLNEKQSSLV